jgi:TRAP-type C4-dicarboxylate transport system permease small subunit
MVAEGKTDTSGVMRLFRVTALVLRALLGLVLIGLVFLNVGNAVARATGIVVIGVDEVLVFGMIWMVMLGMLLVTAERGHINFELVTSRVGPRMQTILMVVTHVILAASCAYAAYQSSLYVGQITRLGQTSMALEMPMLIPHSAVIVGFGGTAIIAAILAIGGIRQLISGEGLVEKAAS